MKKKIFLGMGSLLLATTSTMAVVSCDLKKPTKKQPKKTKPIEKYKGESSVGDLLHGFLPNLLKDNAKKDKILENVDKILAGGISKVKDVDLKAILKSFKVSGSLSGTIFKLLKSDLLERVFVKGFADIQTELAKPGATYKSKKESVKTFVESVLDAPQKGDIFTRELLTKLLIGFENTNDLARIIIASLNKVNIKSSGWDGMASALFFGVPILQKGLLGSRADEIKSSFDILTGKGQLSFVTQMLGSKLTQAILFDQNYTSIKNKEDFTKSIYSLINGGLKSLKGKDNNDLITFIESFLFKKSIQKKDTTNSSENKKNVKNIINILINNSEEIYTFLKYGFSQDNWKELDSKLFRLVIKLVPYLKNI